MLTITTSGSTPKQINLLFSGASGTVLYTVPAGKVCKGTFFGFPNNGTSRITINDNTFDLGSGTAGYGTISFTTTLAPGTVLKATAQAAGFVGVEE